MEVLAFVTSFAALAVSAVALYLASLRPAEIVVDVVEDLSEPLTSGGHARGRPNPTRFRVAVSIWNTGAQGGILEGIQLDDFLYPAVGPWAGLTFHFASPSQRETNPSMTFPQALEGGDVETAFLHATMIEGGDLSAEEYAEALRGLRTITVKLRWSFTRAVGLPRRLRRTRQQITREITAEIDVWRYVASLQQGWAQNPSLLHLCDIAGNPLDASG